MSPAGRPRRSHELARTALEAGASEESVRAFFFRPGKLSEQMRRRIADAVARTGYRPGTATRAGLRGVAVGYEIPRLLPGSTPSPVMSRQLQLLVRAIQHEGGVLVPFIVDPPLQEPLAEEFGVAWLARYQAALAPDQYLQAMSTQGIRIFIVNDPRINDHRIARLTEQGVPLVALARPVASDDPTCDELNCSWVANDYVLGFTRLIADLRRAGYERIGHVRFAPDGSAIPVVRRKAMAEVLPDAPFLEISYERSLDSGEVPEICRFLERTDLDAVVCDSDDIAAVVLDAAQQLGRDCRRAARTTSRLAITGIDDGPARRHQDPAVQWPTLALDEDAYYATVVDVVITHMRGELAPMQRTVAPILVGALDGPSDEHR